SGARGRELPRRVRERREEGACTQRRGSPNRLVRKERRQEVIRLQIVEAQRRAQRPVPERIPLARPHAEGALEVFACAQHRGTMWRESPQFRAELMIESLQLFASSRADPLV